MKFNKAIRHIRKVDSRNVKPVIKILEFNKDKFTPTLKDVKSKSVDGIICSILREHYVGLPDNDTLTVTIDRIKDANSELANDILENYRMYQKYLTHLQRNDLSRAKILKTYLKMHSVYNKCVELLENVQDLDKKCVIENRYDIT